MRLENINLTYKVYNTQRAIGTRLSHYIHNKYGDNSLDIDTINLNLNGSVGQSLGAFLAKGISFALVICIVKVPALTPDAPLQIESLSITQTFNPLFAR